MKMRLFITLILAAAPALAISQSSVYHPFPEDSVVWRLECGGLGWNCNCTCTGGVCVNESDRQFYYGNDTIINSITYHQVLTDQYNSDYWMGPAVCNPGCSSWLPNLYSYTGIYYAAIRQDIAQKKVFMYNTSTGSDILLYDFNLNLGDTLGPTAVNITNTNKVNLIDSVLVGTEYHKRYWLWDISGPPPTAQDSGYVALIEGIGSTFGLFENLVTPFEYQCNLACVNIDSVTVYPASGWNCNFMTAGIEESALESEIKLIPNPAHAQVTIQFPINTISIQITDMLGKVVYSNREPSSGSEPGKLTLETSAWDSGMYFVRTEGEKVSVEKLMIQK